MQAQKPEFSDIACFVVNFQSHIYPALGFLSELEAQGMKYDVYGPTTLVQKFFESPQRNSFLFEELECKGREEPDIKNLILPALEGFLQTTITVKNIWEKRGKIPKLIIADFCAPYAQHLAKHYNIPLLVFCHIFSHNELLWAQLKQILKGSFDLLTDQSLIPLVDQIKHDYGISIRTIKDLLIVGDRNISFLPKFVGELICLENKNSNYIGPGYRENVPDNKESDFDHKILQSNDFIYINLGTFPMHILGGDYLSKLLKVFEGTEHKVLISGVRGDESMNAKTLPQNIIVKNWVPQIEVLEHSKLFISQVSAGSLSEALGKGVPIVAIPTFADQFALAQVVEELKIGRWVKENTPENIRKATEEVLKDESIRENCKKYKGMIDPEVSRSKFIEIVKAMIP